MRPQDDIVSQYPKSTKTCDVKSYNPIVSTWINSTTDFKCCLSNGTGQGDRASSGDGSGFVDMGGGRDDGSSSEAVIKLARKRQSMMCQRIHPHGFVLT